MASIWRCTRASPPPHLHLRSTSASAASPPPRQERSRARLASGGVVLHEQYDEPDYVNAKCVDPDGYEIEIYWEP